MKIIYKENPLASVVELNDQEKELLLLKLKLETYSNYAFYVNYYLDEKRFDLEKVKENANIINSEKDIDEEAKRLFEAYLEALTDTHCGDCTAFPASCVKCHAEGLLNIDTIPGLGKHPAHYIFQAFDNERTFNQALDYLENYDFSITEHWKGDEEAYNSYIPRWKEEIQSAIIWLRKYRREYLDG